MQSPKTVVDVSLDLTADHHIDLVQLATLTCHPFINLKFLSSNGEQLTPAEHIFDSFCILEEGFESPLVLQKLLDYVEDLHFLLFERHVSDFEEEGDGGGDGAEAVGELSGGHEVANKHLDDVRLALVDAGCWDCEELLECD